jgi:glycosyltransferase involved in cell wall biosynthesis
MLISVVIPTYNRAALLGRAIASVLAQTYPHLELIVVDDGSNDGTSGVVGAFRDPRVRFLGRPRNDGVSRARNAGIRIAAGEWVAFLDSDDEWLPGKLERQLDRWKGAGDPGVAVIYGAYYERHGVSGRSRVKPPHFFEGDLRDRLLRAFDVRTSTVLARRDALLAVGGFRDALRCHEDTDLWMRLIAASHRFGAVREPLTILHRHPGPHQHSDLGARAEAARLLEAEWGSTFRRQGPAAYRAWRAALGARRGPVEFLLVRETLARRGRIAAWRAWARMAPHALVAPRWVIQALALVVLGRGPYARLAAIRGALARRGSGDDSPTST